MKKLIRILIIEDNADHIELLTQLIERHLASVDIHTVETLDDAMDFIDQTTYNLVLTDCYLNDKSILEKIPSLKEKLGHAPIIVITGSGDESLAAEVIKKGGAEYLVKTKDSLEKIPQLIKKYTCGRKMGGEIVRNRETAPLKDRILDEVASLSRAAHHISASGSSQIPDIKQLETLLDQIRQLKDLASKLMGK